MIQDFAKRIPDSIKGESGAVFYSGRNAFSGKKDLYIVGLNPGGDDNKQKDDTISKHMKKVLEMPDPNWSEYVDEKWNGEAGTTGLQPRIRHLLEELGLSPHDVPSSNLCFIRSSTEKSLGVNVHSCAELCWEFHQEVIDILGIRVMLCFGKTAGAFVKNKIGAAKKVDDYIEENDRKWKSEAFENNRGQIVIVVAHPSRANWNNPNSDPSAMVKRQLDKVQIKPELINLSIKTDPLTTSD